MTARDARRADSTGLLLMVASAACFAAMAPFTRKWLTAVDPQSIVLARALVMLAGFGAWGLARRTRLGGRDRAGLLLRGFLGYLAISCYVWSTQRLPSGQAVLLQYSHPVFVAALAPVLLKERPGPLHWPLVLAGFAGLAVAIGVGDRFHSAAAIGLAGALLSGLAYMTVRRISATEPPATIVFWFALVMLPCSALGAAIPWSPLDAIERAIGFAGTSAGAASDAAAARHLLPAHGSEWFGCAAVVAAGLLGQITLTEGLARAGAARAVAVTMSGPLFGLLFDRLFFGRSPTRLALAGTAVVVGALALLAWLKPPAAITAGEAE